jgi:phosphoglycolate phosphatase
MMRIAGVLFDKDGTLFDFSSTWEAWAASFLRRIATDDSQAAYLGHAIGFDLSSRRFEADSIVIAGTPDEVVAVLQAHLPHIPAGQLLNIVNAEATVAPQVEAVPLKPLLAELRADEMRLGVVTNDAEVPAKAHLDGAAVTEFFDFIAGCDSGFGAKPAPGQLLAFSESVALEPAQVLMVGDSLHDLLAARAAGMPAVGVLTGLAEASVLAPHAEAVLPDIGYIPAWLSTRNRETA